MIARYLRICSVFGIAALIWGGSRAVAAPLGVQDNAHFFSAEAISQADQIIHQIDDRFHHDVLVETIPDVPQDMRQQLETQGKERFFAQWADQRLVQKGIRGVYILICKEPAHLQVAVGNETQQRLFTTADRDELSRQLLAAFKAKNFDQGLISGLQFIQQQMNAHEPNGVGGTSAQSGTGAVPGPAYPQSNNPSSGTHFGFGFGGIACLIIGVILFIALFRGILGRRGGQPGGYYPQGPGYPPQGGGYPPQGGGYGYGGGGGGMGRGFLGGLLGGALGGYAADRLLNRGQQPTENYVPPGSSGGGSQDPSNLPDTSASSTGGDFGSSDSGGGGGADFGSGGGGGGDFGGGGGGGDFGGGGGDAGGGGGGADFGGGGGGGDSGGGGGGDF